MPAGDEQTQPKRRRTVKIEGQAGRSPEREQEPLTMLQPAGERQTSPRQTEDHGYDQGLIDIPKTSTSVIRRMGGATSSSIPRITQATNPIPPRQRKTMTRDFSPAHGARVVPAAPPAKRGFIGQLKQMHWLFLVGLGMVVALILWMVGSSVLSWGIQRYNDLRYGNPRTFHIDKAVGHGGDSDKKPSHFVAMNWNRQAVVIELKAGDPQKAITYVAPIYIVGDNGEAPVTLDFKDVNGDQKPDMIIRIQLPTEQVFAFINDPREDKFRPSAPNDNIKL